MVCGGDNVRSSVVCSGDIVKFSVFLWCVLVTMSDLVYLCGVVCNGDNARSSVFVWRGV